MFDTYVIRRNVDNSAELGAIGRNTKEIADNTGRMARVQEETLDREKERLELRRKIKVSKIPYGVRVEMFVNYIKDIDNENTEVTLKDNAITIKIDRPVRAEQELYTALSYVNADARKEYLINVKEVEYYNTHFDFSTYIKFFIEPLDGTTTKELERDLENYE